MYIFVAPTPVPLWYHHHQHLTYGSNTKTGGLTNPNFYNNRGSDLHKHGSPAAATTSAAAANTSAVAASIAVTTHNLGCCGPGNNSAAATTPRRPRPRKLMSQLALGRCRHNLGRHHHDLGHDLSRCHRCNLDPRPRGGPGPAGGAGPQRQPRSRRPPSLVPVVESP